MRNLQTDAEDPFLAALKESSDENIEQFVNDTLQRGKARNTSGDHTINLNRIEAAHTAWRTGRSKTDIGEQKVATGSVQNTITATRLASRELFVAIQSRFGIASPILVEFFPKGLSEINYAAHGDYAQILTRFKDKTDKYKTDLGQPWADRAAALLIAWDGVKGIQSDKKSAVAEGAAEMDNTLPELAKALTAHYLTVRLKNEANPSAAVAIYFDESPLRRNRTSGNAAEDGLGRLVLQANLPDGTPATNAAIEYRNTTTGKVFTGKTDAQGRYRSSNQSTGPVEGKVIATDGKAAAFALEIQDDADPVHILVLG